MTDETKELYAIEWKFRGEKNWRKDGRNRVYTQRKYAEMDRQITARDAGVMARVVVIQPKRK